MDSNTLMILAVTGTLSFVVGNLLRRAWLKRRNQKAQQLLRDMQALAKERQLQAPPALNKAKRRRQQRERGQSPR
jgi:biopolymer transport protein ExbB/TolQ